MSWKYEVHGTSDPAGHFVSNGLRFGSETEANMYGRDWGMRWFGFDEGRSVESPDPVTHAWAAGMCVRIEALPADTKRCDGCNRPISAEQYAEHNGLCNICHNN